jgi:hypothetical protein
MALTRYETNSARARTANPGGGVVRIGVNLQTRVGVN